MLHRILDRLILPLFAAIVLLFLAPGIARAGELAPTNPIGQIAIQWAWVAVMAMAIYLLRPLLAAAADAIQTYRDVHKTSGMADLALKAASLFARAAAAGVVQVESELRPTIKDIGADGKISDDEQARLRNEAASRGIDWLKATAPGILAELGLSVPDLMVKLGPHVETAAATLAGNSRQHLEARGDTAPGPSTPAPA